MSLYDKGFEAHPDMDSAYWEGDLKQTIQDFTEELKEEFNEWYEKKEKLPHLMWNRIDKLNQKHYGDKLLLIVTNSNIHSQEVDVKNLKEDNKSSPDTICECGAVKDRHPTKYIIGFGKCKKFKPKEKLR